MNRCPEEITLRKILEKYLLDSTELPTKVTSKLGPYKHAGLDSLVVLMKAEQVSFSDKKFYKLNLNQTLKENLVGKTIVEFPVLYICIHGFITTKKPPAETKQVDPKNGTKKEQDKPNLLVSSDLELYKAPMTIGLGLGTATDDTFLDISPTASVNDSEDELEPKAGGTFNDIQDFDDEDEEEYTMNMDLVPTYRDLIKN